MRWDRQEPGQGGIAKPVGDFGLGGGVDTAMERGEEGMGRFGSLQEVTPSPRLLIGELPELEDDGLAVRAIVPIGMRKAVGTVGGAFIVADSPMEVKRFQIDHVQFLDVYIFMKNRIHKEQLSC